MNRPTRTLALAGALMLAACESSFDVDVVVNPLPTTNQDQLTATVRIEGFDLQTTGDQTVQIDRNAVLELLSTPNDRTPTPVDLVSNAKIDDGEYEGLRLRLATNEGSVTSQRIGVPRRPIVAGTATSAFSEVAFVFEEDQDDNVSLTVALDLPLSLSEDEDSDEFVLNPLVRAMESGDAATIQGTIPVTRLNTQACLFGASVYAFVGANVDADERDGQGVEPVATTLVSTVGTPPSYSLPFLVPGTYSLALTCDGEREDGLEEADPEMIFTSGPEDLDLSAGEVFQVNFQP